MNTDIALILMNNTCNADRLFFFFGCIRQWERPKEVDAG